MSTNTRFYVLLGVVLAVVAGMYLLVRRAPESQEAADTTASTRRANEPAAPLSAPEITSSRRESRLAPVSTRTAALPSIPGGGKSGNYAITGLVVLESDQSPITNASVLVYYVDEGDYFAEFNEAVAWKASTSSDGLFRVAGLPAGRFVVAVSKGNLGGVDMLRIDAREIDDKPTTIELRPVGYIAGHVRNEAGEPLPGAFVVLDRGQNEGADAHGYSQSTAAADGSFRLEYVPEGVWSVRAQADGYTFADANDIPPNSENALIILKRGGSVAGIVIDAATEKPVPNVDVRLAKESYETEFSQQRATTDENGRFTIRDLADGEYKAFLYRQPYVVANEFKAFTIDSANHVTDLELRVLRGGVITGRATDAVTGAPIAGMEFSTRGPTSTTAETDSDGVYRIEGLNAGSYVVRRRWMPGYRHGEDRENKSATVELGKETSGIDFSVPPGVTLSGRVVDENGAPLVMVEVSSETNETREGDSSQTDANGRWAHRGFSPGAIATIYAQKAGYFADPIENVTISDQSQTNFEIVMKPGGTISGIVVDQTGAPVKQTTVAAKPVDTSGAKPQNGWSRDDGAFTINGLSPGTYKLTARPQNTYTKQSSRETEVTVAKGERVTDVRVVVDMDAGMKLAGRVVDASGLPIEGAGINVSAPDKNVSGNARTDADGHFEIVGLEAGEYRVFAHQEKYSRVETKAIAPDTNMILTLRGKATIEGRVVDARSGAPVTAFEIQVRAGEETTIDPASRLSGGKPYVDEQGQFKVTADEGTNTLRAQAAGYAPAARVVPDARADQTTSGVVIRLEPGGVVEGTVTNAQGEAVAGANIWINNVPQFAWENRQRAASASTDANGYFRIDSLPQSDITLIAVHADYLPGQIVVHPSPGKGASASLVLGTGGGLEGTIRIGGKPAVGYLVNVSIPQPPGHYNGDATAGEEGKYLFQSLPPGEARVTVTGKLRDAPNRSTQRQTTIFNDQVTVLDIDIEGGTAGIEGVVTREGRPLANVTVDVYMQGIDQVGEAASVLTNGKGEYRIADMPAGPANVTFNTNEPGQHKGRQVTLEDGVVLKLNENFLAAVPVNVSMRGVSPGVPITVTIYGGPVEFVEEGGAFTVRGEQAYGSIGGIRDVPFEFPNVEVGEYTIVAIAREPGENNASVKIATEAITVTKNNPLKIELTLR